MAVNSTEVGAPPKKMVDEQAVEPHAFVLSSQSSKPPGPTTQKLPVGPQISSPTQPDREGQPVGPHAPRCTRTSSMTAST
jgi:hypothetical protein